ncbi:TPA: 4Fe-4S binding protein [Candidatus Galligastranaerophilus intestinavium]|uniref:4Fe-4S binding protein n=1 Tax=Candidatus Galligastranaerophilus intestinavium TaxID=2840836 RepID=A0A9D1FHM9_9BACT|nr:4Fe-4S binding protein [Candidatus Galligastranaerophilus intestinavium]
MFDTLKSRIYQGEQFIKDIQNAQMRSQFRGLPKLCNSNCNSCAACLNVCPTGALKLNPLSIDMGKCTFCGACKNVCKTGAIDFSNFYKLSATSADKLVITEDMTEEEFSKVAIEVKKEIKKVFGKSLKLRQVSAAGCNGCEMELNACSNVNFDMGRFGIDFVASPRHADGLVITGPISKNMAYALEDCYKSTPDPKVVILCGACAISGGVFKDSSELNREFLQKYPIDLYIPGCPVHPLTFINGILGLIGR